MPTQLQTYIDLGYADGGTALAALLNARNHLYSAGDAILANNWSTAKTQLYESANDFADFGTYLLQDNIYNHGLRKHWKDALYWINNNWPSGGVVDMDAIINAMLGATHNQLEKFIGIEDAYRMALWNAPFNADFYAALGRGFSKWPEP